MYEVKSRGTLNTFPRAVMLLDDWEKVPVDLFCLQPGSNFGLLEPMQ